jgi:thymidylate kinase
MRHEYSGKHVLVDGLDGVGKGEALIGIYEYLRDNIGKRVVDIENFVDQNGYFPDFECREIQGKPNPYFLDPHSLDVLFGSEPTNHGVGRTIRFEVIQENGRDYTASETAEWFSHDRNIWYRRVVIPALENGITVLQSRGLITTLVYQKKQAQEQKESEITYSDILQLPGNRVAMQNAPDLIIIPTVENVEEVMDRLRRRDKTDGAIFENIEFQRALKPLYESPTLADFFQRLGTKVVYIDAGDSVEETRAQAIKAYVENV